jgi:hypothetical protein
LAGQAPDTKGCPIQLLRIPKAIRIALAIRIARPNFLLFRYIAQGIKIKSGINGIKKARMSLRMETIIQPPDRIVKTHIKYFIVDYPFFLFVPLCLCG